MLIGYEKQIVIRTLSRLSKLGKIHPGDKLRAANWILNDCDKSQLLKIEKLAQRYNRRPSPEALKFFLESVLNR